MSDSTNAAFAAIDRLASIAHALADENGTLMRRIKELERRLAEARLEPLSRRAMSDCLSDPMDQSSGTPPEIPDAILRRIAGLEAESARLRQAVQDMDGEAYLGLLADGSPTASLREIQRLARAALNPAAAKEERK